MKTANSCYLPAGKLLLGSICLVALASGVRAQSELKLTMRDAATHSQLSESLRKLGPRDPMKEFKPTTGEDPSVVNRPQDLLSRSDIVCFGGAATLVPKRAILQIPKNLKDRMVIQPGVRIKTWSDFYAVNRGWITTVEVSRDQAEGRLPLAEETQTRIVKSGNLIVATFQGGPISVLPPKVPAAVAPTANTPSSAIKPKHT